MSGPARIFSFDALEEFHGQLAEFGLKAEGALCAAELEVRRTLDWLHDQLRFWQQATDRCQEEVNRARTELSLRRTWGAGKGSGTTEQEIALQKARQRLRHAEEKVEATRRWLRQLPEHIRRYEGPARHLSGMLAADLKQALALLARKVAALEKYAQTIPPQEQS